MAKVSVLIPARNEPFLQRTVDGALSNATGDVEVIVLLDGVPAEVREDPRVTVILNEEPEGIGAASWKMAQVATGDYLMKLDAHCLLAEGYDEVLVQDCDQHDLLVPSRWQLKDETWSRGYGPIDYLYVTYPWLVEPQFGAGMHGKKWLGENGLEGHYFWKEKHLKHIPIDDIMTFQGSLWFIRRDYFLTLEGVDTRYWLWQEAQSIGMKVWLSGGRCLVDKNTWYAHLHKGKRHGRGYFVSKSHSMRTNTFSADYWMNDKWDSPLRIRGIHWFVDHFWPIPGWPEDWDNPKYQEEFIYPRSDRSGR